MTIADVLPPCERVSLDVAEPETVRKTEEEIDLVTVGVEDALEV